MVDLRTDSFGNYSISENKPKRDLWAIAKKLVITENKKNNIAMMILEVGKLIRKE